jgi:hypothetical protein
MQDVLYFYILIDYNIELLLFSFLLLPFNLLSLCPPLTTAASPKTSLDDTQLAPHGYVLLLPRLREAADLDPLAEEDAVGRPAKVEHAAVSTGSGCVFDHDGNVNEKGNVSGKEEYSQGR